MVVLGLILIVIGLLVAGFHVLFTIGVILLIVGLILKLRSHRRHPPPVVLIPRR